MQTELQAEFTEMSHKILSKVSHFMWLGRFDAETF